jgi:metal-responsive CopG/Arc/MetJ family transcriptional regulator
MPPPKKKYEVVSVSLPRDLVKRANAVIPKAKRSRVITSILTAFLDSVSRKQMELEYTRYYTQRSAREAHKERDILNDWKLTDDHAWAILEREETSGRRKAG